MDPITLQVSPEFVALGNVMTGLIADIKAGKSALVDLEDAIVPMLAALGAAANVLTDAKMVDNQVYLVRVLLAAFEPSSAAQAPAAPGA